MAAFDYEAIDAAGRTRKGVISADSSRLARRELKRKKLLPVRVEEARGAKVASGAGLFARKGLAAKDLMLITRQLSTLIGAAAPIEEALNTIALQAEKPDVRKTLLSVRSAVTEGQRLCDALALYPRSFSPLYRSMVAAGESSGSLSAVLDRLADYLEKSHKMRASVTTALIYPVFLAVTAISVIVILMTFVVPKVVEQYDGLGQELPALTQAMIGISAFMQSAGVAMALLIVATVAGFIRALRHRDFKRRVDRLLLRLPLIGRLNREMQAARLARTLSTLLAAGTPVLEALAAARQTVGNLIIKDAVADMVAQLREGSSISVAFRRSGVFPAMLIYMTAMGEKGGILADMLAKSADYLEAEFEAFTQAALSLLEPIIIITMGMMVALIVLSILMPILQLNSLALG